MIFSPLAQRLQRRPKRYKRLARGTFAWGLSLAMGAIKRLLQRRRQTLVVMIRTAASDLLGAVQLLGENEPYQLVRKHQA